MKIVVAYSGGLDTSVLLLWLKEKYNAEIIAYCADCRPGRGTRRPRGQGPRDRCLQVLHRRPEGRVRPQTTSSPCSRRTPSTKAATCLAPPSPAPASPRVWSMSPSSRRRGRHRPRCHRQGQRPGPLRAFAPQRPRARHQDDRPLARRRRSVKEFPGRKPK